MMRPCFSALSILALSGSAFAASEGHGDAQTSNVMFFTLMQFAMAILAFGIVFFILSKAVWPKILGGLEAREQKIRSEVFAAEEARKRANEALKDYEKSLSEARSEATRMIEQTRAEQARMAADLRIKAESELNLLRDQARASIEAAKKAALTEIYGETASLATAVATKILQREFNAQDQGRMIEESVQQFTRDFAKA